MISLKDIEEVDKSQMFQVLKDFPSQIRFVLEKESEIPFFLNRNTKFVILGIGGSAIAGDFLQATLRNSELNFVEIFVNRNYLPLYKIDKDTNVVVSSYSGNTEETLEAFKEAQKHTQNFIGITSGGILYEILKSMNYPIIQLPIGYQPRAALGFSFFSILLLVWKTIYGKDQTTHLNEKLVSLEKNLQAKSQIYSELRETNPALNLAYKILNKIPIIYACEETMYPVAFRFKAQIQENAKNLAFASAIPEMNHNEINSFAYPKDILERVKIILIKDANDHPKNIKRIEAMRSILSYFIDIEILESKETDFLFRMFDLIYFLDWVSYYLAIMNRIDPTPIPVISKLKSLLQR
jgi:glucose/mannose-6-phosphate isomerase